MAVIIDQNSLSGAVRLFSFWIANGTMGLPLLDKIPYKDKLLDEPSALETVYAVFINNLKFDAEGKVTNARYAERRAARYIQVYFGGELNGEEPELEVWEVELY